MNKERNNADDVSSEEDPNSLTQLTTDGRSSGLDNQMVIRSSNNSKIWKCFCNFSSSNTRHLSISLNILFHRFSFCCLIVFVHELDEWKRCKKVLDVSICPSRVFSNGSRPHILYYRLNRTGFMKETKQHQLRLRVTLAFNFFSFRLAFGSAKKSKLERKENCQLNDVTPTNGKLIYF